MCYKLRTLCDIGAEAQKEEGEMTERMIEANGVELCSPTAGGS
jgi:hypothetical protein